jgi:hypothetical protein
MPVEAVTVMSLLRLRSDGHAVTERMEKKYADGHFTA